MRRFILIASVAVLPLFAGATQAQNGVGISNNPAFEAFGGEAGLARSTDDGVERLVHDDRIKKYFVNANLPHLKKMLTEEFCVLLRGNCTYEGGPMKEVHAQMGLRNADFNALAEDFQLAWDDAHVPFIYQNVLLAKLAPMEHDIVTK